MNENGLSAADVALLTGAGNNNNDGFGGGGWGGMIWLFAILALMGGWGNGGFGGGNGGGGGYGNMQLGYDFPWLLNGQNGINNNVSDGFRDAQLHDSVSSVRDGVSNLATQLCGCCGDMQMAMANGFSGVQQSLCNGFAGTTAAITAAQNGLTQQLYNNEVASLNRSFAEQTANTQGFTGVNAGIADLRYTVATENCADRAALNEGVRDIVANQTAGFQRILDQMCQDKIDAKNDEIAQLRQEVLYARGQASQIAQNQQVIDGIYDRLNTCPVGTTPVYGRTPIFTCNSNNGCGCGCNGLNL